LGCFEPCGLTFNAGVVGMGEAGVWIIRLTFGRRNLTVGVTLAEGDDIIFPLDWINELYTYTAQITKPDGTIFEFTDPDNVVFDCFKFSTQKGGQTAITL